MLILLETATSVAHCEVDIPHNCVPDIVVCGGRFFVLTRQTITSGVPRYREASWYAVPDSRCRCILGSVPAAEDGAQEPAGNGSGYGPPARREHQ